ncbi:MAG: hypothetical protein ACM3NR_02010 [Methanosarcina sp.]
MKILTLLVLAIVTSGFLIISQPLQNTQQDEGIKDNSGFYTSDVKKVVDAKCYGCHSIQGKSQKAKDKLMWDSLPGLPKRKMVSTLGNIVDELEKNDMPPEEFLKKFPDAALVGNQKEILTSWAGSKADNLLK